MSLQELRQEAQQDCHPQRTIQRGGVCLIFLAPLLRHLVEHRKEGIGSIGLILEKRVQLFANGQRCDDISEYGRCCFLYSLLKPAEWYKNKGITGFWELAGLVPAPVPAQSFKDVLMAPTLIGMFQANKFLPPQLNLVLELEFAEPADALRPGGGSTDYSIENVRVLASQVTLDSALYESYQKILLSGRSLVFAYPTMHTQVSSIPAGSTSHNVTVARAFTKLLGAFVSFRDIDDNLGSVAISRHPGDGSQFSTSPLESQMQLGGSSTLDTLWPATRSTFIFWRFWPEPTTHRSKTCGSPTICGTTRSSLPRFRWKECPNTP